MASDTSGPSVAASARTRSRARFSRFFCTTASMVRRCTFDCVGSATTLSATCGASNGIGRRPAGTGSVLASAISSAGTVPIAAKRSSTRSRAARAFSAKRSGRRSSGDCGSATKSAASPSDSRRGSCRNRRATRHGCPRCCLHRARDRGRARGSRPWSAHARSRSREPSGAVLSPRCGALRAARAAAPPAWSRSRRPSEAGRWLRIATSPATPRADRRRDERGNACPHRRTARRRTRIDVGNRRRQPPAAFARRISAQQAPFPIDHAGREIEVLAERRRAERSDPPRRAGKSRRAYENARENEMRFLTHHFAAVTSMLPLPVRPKRSGRYMSSTTACGRT